MDEIILPEKGDTIELIKMNNDPNPLKEGDTGIVYNVVDLGRGEYQIQAEWESGRNLHLIVPEDTFKIIKKASN